MKKIFCLLVVSLLLFGCSQSLLVPVSSATPVIPTSTVELTQTPTLTPTATPIPRKGVVVSNQGSSFGAHIPQSWLAEDPGQARYKIDLVVFDRVMKSCQYENFHTLELHEQGVHVQITDLETGQWAAEQSFTDLEYEDTTCPKTYAFSPGKDETKTLAWADDDEDEISIFVNWLTETMDELAQAPAPGTQQFHKVGQVISAGEAVLVVLGWENASPDGSGAPSAGNRFVTVEMLIVNNSRSIMPYSTLGMRIKDATGRKYEEDMSAAAVGGARLGGRLAPGEKVRGKVVFQVPENAQGLQFIFDEFVPAPDIVLVDLGAQPVNVEPPANLPGETSQQAYHVGDGIDLGTLNISVNAVQYPAGSEYNKPIAGHKFLVVDLTIVNKGAAAVSFLSITQTSLKDSDGRQYWATLMASAAAGGSPPDGDIAPGETVRGQVGFQVPENASGFIFVFEAHAWEEGKVFVALPQ